MSIFSTDTPDDGVLLDENVAHIPLMLYEQMIRAEAERDILEAAIKMNKYSADSFMRAIIAARNIYAANHGICIQSNVGREFGMGEPAEDVSEDA